VSGSFFTFNPFFFSFLFSHPFSVWCVSRGRKINVQNTVLKAVSLPGITFFGGKCLISFNFFFFFLHSNGQIRGLKEFECQFRKINPQKNRIFFRPGGFWGCRYFSFFFADLLQKDLQLH